MQQQDRFLKCLKTGWNYPPAVMWRVYCGDTPLLPGAPTHFKLKIKGVIIQFV
jgi:hypothetical protein